MLHRATALRSPGIIVGDQRPCVGQPQGRDQVAHSAFATLGSDAGTSSHCGAVKNLTSPCAVFT